MYNSAGHFERKHTKTEGERERTIGGGGVVRKQEAIISFYTDARWPLNGACCPSSSAATESWENCCGCVCVCNGLLSYAN